MAETHRLQIGSLRSDVALTLHGASLSHPSQTQGGPMALMFPRLARNFARNGYFPTDEVTLERALQALAPAPSGRMRICDPCAGEGVALAEAAHILGRDKVQALAVEYDRERADHARGLLDRVLHGAAGTERAARQAQKLRRRSDRQRP